MLALTMGEPAGVGGEITLAAWQELRGTGPAFLLIDDPERVRALAARMGLGVPVETVATPAEAGDVFARALPVLPLGIPVSAEPGVADPANAAAVITAIREAVRLAQAGAVDGIVTNPIHKAVLLEGGFHHPGHTEFLAELAGVERTVMLLAGPGIRVVPVTIHIPLADVPAELTAELLEDTARIVDRDMRGMFGLKAPRLVVAGLNPHAGENGQIGREEVDLVAPAVARLAAEGLSIEGPQSADTMFHERARARYDVALCMYHDQALIPIKTLAFDEGVNVTLGLPFVRTSPDHGTAFNIAGQGLARPNSLIAAITLADELSRNRRAL
ncbi:4-hydroxythreonine-4-phosphate dehydrogenase PdxA [Acuticoccus yangtzensis]|uniref:4-hydroxythreonine-4-phosphate dehydrogenase PdxA n=1 Tax=Acuticoccus yangtzensis TaxID=1443441 RepID=UPI000949ABFB|nr:4-hydroxythreonine-4-phosphate dehydrogenase PdxA [Acuticoccus yangtzensis]ORE95243.1 4-hydroxy-L-threonine phosphate dehydrogenase [Stappia sp. 22II-S9-Z10]